MIIFLRHLQFLYLEFYYLFTCLVSRHLVETWCLPHNIPSCRRPRHWLPITVRMRSNAYRHFCDASCSMFTTLDVLTRRSRHCGPRLSKLALHTLNYRRFHPTCLRFIYNEQNVGRLPPFMPNGSQTPQTTVSHRRAKKSSKPGTRIVKFLLLVLIDAFFVG